MLAWAAGQTVTAGVLSYDDVLITQLDPYARALKYNAAGLGLIRVNEGLDRARTAPERAFTRVAVAPLPLPAGLSMLGAALIGFADWLHRKRR